MRRFLLLISLLLVAAFSSGASVASMVGELCRTTVGELSRTTVASTGSATIKPITEPSSVTELVEVTVLTDTSSHYLFPFDNEETTRYTVAITFKNASFSGICVTKRIDGQIAGSIVNEFGIRAFDFKMSENRRHVKLLNVMKPLDKCLIRKTIARDLKRLFSATMADEYVTVDGSKVIIRRPNRSYTFSKMNIPE